jgi:alkylated DNA repair protein alkB family protein 6
MFPNFRCSPSAQPHEDGPSYHPVVATLSLQSHAIFHYYQYAEYNANDIPSSGIPRAIDPTPVHSIFLEPRSLVITTASLYTSHLHGIQEKEEDVFIPAKGDGPPVLADLGVPVINWNLVAADHVKEIFQRGGILRRGIRYSLTCRDVERVASSKAIYGY